MSSVIKRTYVQLESSHSSYLVPSAMPVFDDRNGCGRPTEADSCQAADQPETKAQRLMEEAKARAASLERAAWDRGFEAGKAEGIETVRSEYSSLLDLIGRVADEIRSRADRLVAESEREIVRLATAVAEKIVRHVIEIDPDATLEIVREAIRRAQGARSLVVRVNPEDLEMLVMRRAELMGLVIDAKNLKIVEDARIGRGGCVVEMDTGAVDARIDEQFAEIGRAFAQELSHNG